MSRFEFWLRVAVAVLCSLACIIGAAILLAGQVIRAFGRVW